MSTDVFTWRLSLTTTPLFVVQAPPASRWRLVQTYYQGLRQELSTILPLVQECLPPERSTRQDIDRAMFSRMEAWYRAVSAQLYPTFDPAEVLPLSRYGFFVATDLVEHEGRMVSGMSGLEQLLGLSHPTAPANGSADPARIVISSGDTEIDLLADLLLAFKEQATVLWENHSIQYLSKLLAQANGRARGQEAIEEKQSQRDRELFEQYERMMQQTVPQGTLEAD